jgi:hypothetical protein
VVALSLAQALVVSLNVRAVSRYVISPAGRAAHGLVFCAAGPLLALLARGCGAR